MSFWDILSMAVGLAMDALAVSIAAGLAAERVTPRRVFRIAWHFGLFQALMPVLGWLAGRTVADYIAAWDHWIAFGLLSFIGGKMLYEAWRGEQLAEGTEDTRRDPTKGMLLMMLCIATSIDALAVGLSLAMVNVSIWQPALVIGVVTCLLSAMGIVFAGRLGQKVERWADAFGGVVLIAIGFRILIEHLTA
ncbi:MAG: manganese efflux pump MntP family protein [Phycisphaerae bacterium]